MSKKGRSAESVSKQKKYTAEYNKRTYANMSIKFRYVEDKDIIDFLNSLPNKSDFIKDLIKREMQNR